MESSAGIVQKTSSLLSIAVIFGVGSLLYALGSSARQAFALRHIPGPWYAAWTNLVLKAKVMQATFKTIHKVGSSFTKSLWYQKFNDGPHPGVFAITDPKEHGVRRRLFAQSFSNTSMLKFETTIRSKVDIAVSKIKRDALAGQADILKWFTFLATDVIGELSFGRSFDMLEQEEKTSYVRDLETTMMIGGIRAELGPLVKIAEKLPIKSLQHVLSLNDRLRAYGATAIERQRDHITKAGDEGCQTLFSKFVDPTRNQELSVAAISAEAGNLIVAGSDTTAVSLTYLVWSLLRPQHRDIKEKLLSEISLRPVDTGMTELSSLKYLRAIVDESLRLYGAAPGSLPRITPAEGAKLGDYFVPGGTTISVQAYTLHRDGSIFAESERFIPERWENPTQQMKDAFMPFGAGSRICLGIHLALQELLLGTFVFFKMCSTAELAASTTDESMEFENYFLIAPKSHKCEIVM